MSSLVGVQLITQSRPQPALAIARPGMHVWVGDAGLRGWRYNGAVDVEVDDAGLVEK